LRLGLGSGVVWGFTWLWAAPGPAPGVARFRLDNAAFLEDITEVRGRHIGRGGEAVGVELVEVVAGEQYGDVVDLAYVILYVAVPESEQVSCDWDGMTYILLTLGDGAGVDWAAEEEDYKDVVSEQAHC
jgi:hypothetical protein